MKTKILLNAKADIPKYFEEFKLFWNSSLGQAKDDDLYTIYKVTLVYKNWKAFFHSIGVKQFDLLANELYEDVNSSLFLSFLGLYRSSHMHMRSIIELSLQLLYFWDHPIEYIKWKSGEFVIKHDQLTDYLLKHPRFDVNVKDILDNITKNWKHYSKHIHGESPIFFQVEKGLKKTNKFSKADFETWKSNFMRNVYYLNKLFILFFKVDLNRMPEATRVLLLSLLKPIDLQELGLEADLV